MKPKFTIILLATIFTFLGVNNVNGQSQWEQTSTPPGGSVWALETIGSNVFAGTTSGGVYFSDDNGTSWIQRNGAFPDMEVYSLAVNGTDIYAGTGASFGSGIYKSSDNGLNWINITPSSMPTFSNVRSLAVNDTHIYAGSSGEGVYMSSLSGIDSESWSTFNTGLINQNIRSLKIKESTIYAGTYGNGVWISPTDSPDWNLTSATMPVYSDYIQALDVSGSTIFSGNISGLPVLYRSIDNGEDWVVSNTDIFNDKPVYAVNRLGDDVYAGTEGSGIFLSSDNGITWSQFNEGFKDSTGNWLCVQINVRSIIFVGSTIFAGTDCGVWKRSLSESLGLNEFSDNNLFTVYPNPNRGIFKIHTSSINKIDIEVFNFLGEKVFSTSNFIEKSIELDLSNSPKGIYYVKLYDGEKVLTEKIVIQ
ncbi:MAG: hypothetical protein ACI8ZM_004745 [Crocinitomix sp.]|jgi:hypothetical protein